MVDFVVINEKSGVGAGDMFWESTVGESVVFVIFIYSDFGVFSSR